MSCPKNNLIRAKAARKPPRGDILVSWASVLALMTLVLTMTGYGVTLAVESLTGVPNQTVYLSATDILGLSSLFVMQVIMATDEVGWLEMMRSAYTQLSLNMFAISLVPATAWLIYRFRNARWLHSMGMKIRDISRKSKERVTVLPKSSWFIPLVSVLLGQLVAVILPIAMWLCVVILVLVPSMVPLMGFTAAKQYLTRYVVDPESCASLRTREKIRVAGKENKAESQPPQAQCLKVLKDREFLGEGRLVVASSAAVVLWDPMTGQAERFPLANVQLRTVQFLGSRAKTPQKEK